MVNEKSALAEWYNPTTWFGSEEAAATKPIKTEANIVCLGGDGIGPEVVAIAKNVLQIVADKKGYSFTFTDHLFGGCSIDAHGDPLTNETLEACRAADAVLMGAIGGNKWANSPVGPEQGLLRIRKELGLFANIRPCQIISKEVSNDASPLRPENLEGVDIVVMRELTGGIYFGERVEGDEYATDRCEYSVHEIERIVRMGADLAMKRGKKLTSVDKANVLATSRLWRKTAIRIVEAEYPELELTHMYVDNAAMQMIRDPSFFDVIVCGNLFGDIISDEASMIPGSLGLLPSASLTASGWGLYEPVHGSAPDITGKGIANPIATILSAAMLLRLSLNMEAEAAAVEEACTRALASGLRTPDIANGKEACTTAELGAAVCKELEGILDGK